MNPSRSHRLIHVLNNCKGPVQYNTNGKKKLVLCFDLSFIKFLNKQTRNKKTAWSRDLYLT